MDAKQRREWLASNRTKVHSKFIDRHGRIVFARKLAAEKPASVAVDADFLPWVFDDECGVWIAFDGRWSSHGPNYDEDREKEVEEQLLQHEVWSRIRQKVLERDDFRCVLCGAHKTSRLHIHHILKRRHGGTHHYDNLITVCPKCHSAADRSLYDLDWERSVDVAIDDVFR